MHQIEAIIFDWAGTTIDYGCFAPVKTFIEIFEEYGLYPTIDETRKPMGMLKRDHIKTMLQMPRLNVQWQNRYSRDFSEDDVDAMNFRFETRLMKIIENFTKPKPYVLETVQSLRDQKIKIGSTTGYTDEMMAIVTQSAAQNGYYTDVWVTPNAVNNVGRPYPYMIFENIKRLKVSSVKNVIKVGDTVSDILEGKNAGVITIGVIEGSSELGLSEEEFNALILDKKTKAIKKVFTTFLNAGADYIINDFRELLPLIQKINEKNAH